MVATIRRERILAALARAQYLSVQEIAAQFSCSVATARRDVQALASAGQVQRSHGGAIATGHAQHSGWESIVEEPDSFLDAKQRIGRVAAAMVASGETIGLSGGTTTYQVARCLRGRPIGAVTNAVDIALELATEAGPRVVLIGGIVDFRHGHELLGPLAEQALDQINMDVLFVSVNGISASAGVTIIGELNAQVMRVMAERTRRLVVVADHSKIGRTALSTLVPLERVDAFITDAHEPSADLEAIRAAGVQVIEA